MFYELRYYQTTPSGSAAFEEAFGSELLPILLDRGFDLVGAWRVHVGEGSGLKWMLRWASMDQRQAAYDAVRADPRNDAFRDRHLHHLVSTSSEILSPAAFSPLR